jgi:outer membrane protein OmpA-like peptidoglycan-associated protein
MRSAQGMSANRETLNPEPCDRMRHTSLQSISLATLAMIMLLGCESMTPRQEGTAKGAAIGAAAGAVIGSATGGSAGTGAVIGGALGAAAGNLWSKNMEDKRVAMEKATQGTGVTVARTADNQLRVNVPSDFSFDVGRADIKPNMRPVLDEFARNLNPHMLVTVVGHTDNTGSDAINNPLSVNRAAAVRDYIAVRGVTPTRIATDGRGSREPVAQNDSPAGRAQNRRVEIFLRDPGAKGGS